MLTISEQSMYYYFSDIARNGGIFFRKANYSRIRAKLAYPNKYLELNDGGERV